MSVRVYQLAKQLGLDNKRVIQLLRERGLDVTGPSNTIPSIYADALIEEIGNKKIALRDEIVAELANEKGGAVHEKKQVAVSNAAPVIPEKIPAHAEQPNRAQIPQSPPRRQDFSDRQNSDRQKRPLMVSVGPQVRQRKRDDDPDVRLPELPKPPQSADEKCESAEKSAVPGFKPFLKKIERQTPKTSALRTIEIKTPVVVRALATQMNVKPFQLISKLMSMNIFASMNQEIDISVAQSVAEKFGYALEVAKPSPEKIAKPKSMAAKPQVAAKKNDQVPLERPPVVCVLGHVDHGKTTLLDAIRHTRVASGEAGGITQHIAAYQIEHSGKKITFIDTPGHAAFSKMRERGANITDIGVLVVAADDGFMPQTEEALKFAKNANIPIVIAINKIDAKGANIDRVKQQMQRHGITSEDWGGDVLCAAISALHGTNIDGLLELIRLQAEMMELRFDSASAPEGVILESKISVGHGATASAIVQDGILRIGDCVICGPCYCKVKSLLDDSGKQIKEAPASTPVSIIGWSAVPEVGAKFTFVENEKIARKHAEENAEELKKVEAENADTQQEVEDIDHLFSAIAAVDEKSLNVIVRADVHGSLEVMHDFLGTIRSKKIKLNIVDEGVGPVGKNDVLSADASHAQIVAFNVKVESNAQAMAKQLGIKIIHHDIIYELIERVREAMAECLDPELQENKLGAAEVRQIFRIKGDTIAGCMVTEGRILRDKFVRVLRRKELLFQGKFASIKRQKEDTAEVRAGFECGVMISGFCAFEQGDILECFEIKKIPPSL
ncbi:MAG: translation initiation factor IF-2 [Puniceicoccales bacterium]|jgi:translation initiation factor IF-2|nr:translation initiation factor IF-2 [Puniceicoccales bacterium]